MQNPRRLLKPKAEEGAFQNMSGLFSFELMVVVWAQRYLDYRDNDMQKVVEAKLGTEIIVFREY